MNAGSSRQLSVLMLSPQYRPIVGGYERAAERLSGALADVGLRVVVIAERRDRAWPAMERIDGYEVQRLFCLYRRHLHAITSLLSFAGFLLRHGRAFDVWHVHQYGYHAALAVVLGKLLHRPVALKLTNSAAMGIEKAMGSGIAGGILRFLHRQVSACIAISDETRAEAIRFGIPDARIHLIPNGVDGRQFYPASLEQRAAARSALGLDCERLVLYVGRLSPEKNPRGLLDAWTGVDTQARDGALLVLVGDGPDWDQVHARAKTPSLVGAVYLAGKRTDVMTWYQAADLYVISSYNEGLSNAMIEALASGLPVIATSVSGAEHIVAADAGIVVPIGDMVALAGAIQNLLVSAEKRSRLGLNARRVFEEHFSAAMVAGQINSLYRLLRRQSQGEDK
ncbi:MAG: glycosyltransferase family 4 protein [Rhodocyclales bacterium]|nr:glycosyltransferase family 4 protein [Rhodocyclales bacterium]